MPSESETSCDILYLDVSNRCFQEDFLMNGFDVETKTTVGMQTMSKAYVRIKGVSFVLFCGTQKRCVLKNVFLSIQSNKVRSCLDPNIHQNIFLEELSL